MIELIVNVTVISTLISAFAGLLVWYINYLRDKAKVKSETMRYCISRFRDVAECEGRVDKIGYLGLLNEELYYIKEGLIDESVAIEWLSGVVDYLPICRVVKSPDGSTKFEVINLNLLEQSNSPFVMSETRNLILRYPLVANMLMIENCNGYFDKYNSLEELYVDRSNHLNLRSQVIVQMLKNIRA